MGGTELRRVIRVVIYAVEQVRSAHAIEARPGGRGCKVASVGLLAGVSADVAVGLAACVGGSVATVGRGSGVATRAAKAVRPCGPALAGLESAEKVLWEVQGLLVEEDVGRHESELRRAGNKLRRQVKAISLAGHRDASDALSDAADAVGAYSEMTRVAFEAGLVG